MAAFRDDMPLIAGVNEDWDENTTKIHLLSYGLGHYICLSIMRQG